MDKITESRINLLHPKVRDEVTKIINEANAILTQHSEVRIVQGFRSIKEQDYLYSLGRTIAGKRVTNAKGGSSFHNYGLAIDFCLLIDGKEISWDINKDFDKDNIPDWSEVRDVFKKYGWEWGGNFKSIKDYPHFQKTFGYSWQQLLQKYLNKQMIINTPYVLI